MKLVNIRKEYSTESKANVQALKGINLEFPNKGFHVIVGKSGSGKSTLLNMIGCLDIPSSGEIMISEMQFGKLTRKEIDYFRASRMGFVFQDYNLISELSVYDNIALPLELLNKDEDFISKRVKSVLDELDLSDCIYRNINELSGGQLQRVALARAVVKEPSIIVADEPTGNLDEETGKSIVEYLKRVSKDVLVIMVTHNMFFANTYGDTIVKLENGKVTDRDIKRFYDLETNGNTDFKTKRISLPLRHSLQLTLKNLFSHKVRLISSIILFSMALVIVYFASNLYTFDFSVLSKNTFVENDIVEFDFRYQNDCDNCEDDNMAMWTNIGEIKSDFPNNYIYYVVDQRAYLNNPLNDNEIPSPEAYINSNVIFNFVVFDSLPQNSILFGKTPEQENEIMITDYIAEMIIRYQIYDLSDISGLIGKEMQFTYEDNTYQYEITGILETDYKKFDVTSDMTSDEMMDEFSQKLSSSYASLYVNLKGLDYLKNNTLSVNILYSDIESKLSFYKMTNYSSTVGLDSNYLLYGENPSENNEVVISLSQILTQTAITYEEFNESPNVILDDWLDKILELESGYYDENFLEGEYTIVGVIDDFNYQNSNFERNALYFSDSAFSIKYVRYFNNLGKHGKVLVDNFNDVERLIKRIDDLSYFHVTVESNTIYNVYSFINSAKVILLWISIFVTTFASLLISSYLLTSINGKRKQIGILRTLGINIIDCMKISLYEGLIILSIVTLITYPIILVFNVVLQNSISNSFNTNIAFFTFDWVDALFVFVVSLFVTILSTFSSMKRITNMEPVDIIRKI